MVTEELSKEVETQADEQEIKEPVAEEQSKTEVIDYELKYKQQQAVLQREVETKKALQVELAQAKSLHQPISEIMDRLNRQGELLATLQDTLQSNSGESYDTAGNPIPKRSNKDIYREQYFKEAEARILSRINNKLGEAGIKGDDPVLQEAGTIYSKGKIIKDTDLLLHAEKLIDGVISSMKPKETPIVKSKTEKEIDPELLKVETGNSSITGSEGLKFRGVVTEEQLNDRSYWEANKELILKAQREGKLVIK